MIIRTATELYRLPTFVDRYNYLKLGGRVGEATFGSERWVNQRFYASREWKLIREEVIARDLGCDLGIEGRDIHDRIYIHHMNPMSVRQIADANTVILEPEFLICVTHQTHNAIHYGDERQLRRDFVPRQSGDTVPWRR